MSNRRRLDRTSEAIHALDVAGCVATGETWMGRPVKSGPVLYLWAEGTHGLRLRVRAWEHAYGRKMTGVHFLPRPVQAANTGEWDALKDLAKELQPALIVVDTQARVTTGLDENSAADMGTYVARLDRLRAATGACVWTVHHQGRNGEHMRGSTALDGAADVVWRTERDGDTVTVTMGKPPKDGPPFDAFTLRLVPMLDSVVLAPDEETERPDRTVARCRPWLEKWAALFPDEWVSVSTIDSNVVPKRTFYDNRPGLLAAQAIEAQEAGRSTRYRVVSASVRAECGSKEPPHSPHSTYGADRTDSHSPALRTDGGGDDG